jgi:hypothetical protein
MVNNTDIQNSNSQQEPEGERGVCAEALQAVRDLADAWLPIDSQVQMLAEPALRVSVLLPLSRGLRLMET